MIFDVLVVGLLFQDEAEYIFELVFVLRFHVAADMVGLDLKLPLEAGILCSLFVDGEGDRVHVEMNGKLIGLSLRSIEVNEILDVFFAE